MVVAFWGRGSVAGDLTVRSELFVNSNLTARGDASIQSNLTVNGVIYGNGVGLTNIPSAVVVGLGSAATSPADAFAPSNLSSYAGSNLEYSDGKFNALPGYSDADATNAVMTAWPNLDMDQSDDLHISDGALNMSSNRISNLANPLSDADAIHKEFLKSVVSCLEPQGDLTMGIYTNGKTGAFPLD
ncbi:MAG TPA: hypothetical protein DCZ95_13955 [Verrucomicrobia bacterium]|nr:hypothetical protein [Verrucomicrobiota bacterium]